MVRGTRATQPGFSLADPLLVAGVALALIVIVTLVGCSSPALDQVRAMSAGDLAAARAKAQAAGDKPGDWCWESLQPVISPSGTEVGIASAIEDSRIIAQAIAGPCTGILGPVLSVP
jgi:hypothetical protein